MGMWDPVTHEHVLEAAKECDDLGQEAFLEHYGFGPARAYQLIVNGRSYDSKAVLGAAFQRATGQRITSNDFSGGVAYNGAASVLRRLGFEVQQTQRTAVRRSTVTKSGARTPALHQSDPIGSRPADVILIGCVKSKLPGAAAAKELYTSPLFHKRRAFAEVSGKPWFILSALHGLVRPDEVLQPYDMYLAAQPSTYRLAWADRVIHNLAAFVGELSGLAVEIHAGSTYVEPLEPRLISAGAEVRAPLHGLTQGEHLAWYNVRTAATPPAFVAPPDGDSVDEQVHLAMAALSRSTPAPAKAFPWGRSDLSQAGMYAWWVDRAGAAQLGLSATGDLSLAYTGQAGATFWPSGVRSNATLLSRIRGQHLGGVITSSTLRQTFAALLREALGLRVVAPKTLDAASEQRLSEWLRTHLWASAWPCVDRDTLRAVEQRVNAELDAPLNLMGASATDLRRRLRAARAALQQTDVNLAIRRR